LLNQAAVKPTEGQSTADNLSDSPSDALSFSGNHKGGATVKGEEADVEMRGEDMDESMRAGDFEGVIFDHVLMGELMLAI